MTADGPGRHVTGRSASIQATTSEYPGSETAGIPASVTTATVSPARTRSMSCGTRPASLCSKKLITRPPMVTPRAVDSDRRRRVSSAATMSAVSRTRRSRSDASAGFPIGVAANTTRPDVMPTTLSPARRVPAPRGAPSMLGL